MITRPIPRIGRWRPRRLLLPAAGIVLIAILAAAFILAAPPLFTPSKSPSKSLADYLASWQAGPVKISVPHYEVIEEKANKTPGNRGVVLTRISIRNLTAQPLDLSEAYTRLVLVVSAQFGDNSHVAIAQEAIPGVPTNLHLYSVGFGTGSWKVLDGNKRYRTADWSGLSLPARQTFTSFSAAENSAVYVTPAPSGPSTSSPVNISPAKLHILGIAWLSDNDKVLGFCPVSAWKGQNSAENFLEA